MMLIWGERICGRVDYVPGKCHVATQFLHLYYVPLIPLSTWVIMDGSEGPHGFHGRQINMSGKSVLFGWLHAALVIFGAINVFWGAIEMAEPKQAADPAQGVLKLVIGLMCLGVWLLFTYRPLRASEKREEELLQHLGIGSLSEDVSVD